MTEMERVTIDMLIAPGGILAIASLVISSMVMGGVLTWFLMRQERWKYESYAVRDSVMGLSMREMDEGHDGRRNFDINSAVVISLDHKITVHKPLLFFFLFPSRCHHLGKPLLIFLLFPFFFVIISGVCVAQNHCTISLSVNSFKPLLL